mgnify:CR=1 FL=1
MTWYIEIPAVNLVGRGCLAQLKDEIGTLGCKKALVVSDKFLTENGVVEKVTKVLDQSLELNIHYIMM